MSNLLNIKDQSGNWIPIPVVTNGIKSITQNEDYTLTITLNDGTTYTTTSIKGEDGQDYVLTEQDKQDIAGLVDTPVDDVQINGQSILQDGVAEIPIASTIQAGVMKVNGTGGHGLAIENQELLTVSASSSIIKDGTDIFRPIAPKRQHESTFYGLAKASGDTTQSQSDNEVGVYTDEAKASIKNMLGVEDVDIDSKAPVITETISGDIVSFDDGADDMPLQSLVVDIDPVQDLHGYDSPWPAGGGKNKYNKDSDYYGQGLFWASSNGTLTSNSDYYASPKIPVKADTQYVRTSGTSANIFFDVNGDYLSTTFTGGTFTTPSDAHFVAFNTANSVNHDTVQLEEGSSLSAYSPYENICPITGWTGCEVQRTGVNLLDTTEWEEDSYIGANGATGHENGQHYSINYSPIKTGVYDIAIPRISINSRVRIHGYDKDKQWVKQVWTDVLFPGTDIYHTQITIDAGIKYIRISIRSAITDIQLEVGSTPTPYEPYQGEAYPITFPAETGTVYGGHIDPINGELVACPYYASYNGETLTGEWISDRDKYVAGTTPTIGAQVVNIGAVGERYPVTATEIRSLLGQNNIWADTGNVSVTYRANTELYIDKQIPDVPVEDVQINGTSIIADGVASIPLANSNDFGVVKLNGNYGIQQNSSKLAVINRGNDSEIKLGTNAYKPIVPYSQHMSTFYGLAKAAGDTTQSSSSNAVGTYTSEAQTAIKQMLGVKDDYDSLVVEVSSTDPVITGKASYRYNCGELYTLSITPPSSGTMDIIFTSGATPTVLTLPETVKMPDWWAGIETNTTYEMCITDGTYCGVMSWAT